MRVKVVGGSVCVFGERGRVYREIESERERDREAQRDGKCVQREGRSMF